MNFTFLFIVLQPERKAWHPVSFTFVLKAAWRQQLERYFLVDYVAPSRIFPSRRLSWSERIVQLLENYNQTLYYEQYLQELPHKRIVRNVRKLLESKPSRVELESVLTALPRGSRPKRNYDAESDWCRNWCK